MDSLTVEMLWCVGLGIAVWLVSVCYNSGKKDAGGEDLNGECDSEKRVA